MRDAAHATERNEAKWRDTPISGIDVSGQDPHEKEARPKRPPLIGQAAQLFDRASPAERHVLEDLRRVPTFTGLWAEMVRLLLSVGPTA